MVRCILAHYGLDLQGTQYFFWGVYYHFKTISLKDDLSESLRNGGTVVGTIKHDKETQPCSSKQWLQGRHTQHKLHPDNGGRSSDKLELENNVLVEMKGLNNFMKKEGPRLQHCLCLCKTRRDFNLFKIYKIDEKCTNTSEVNLVYYLYTHSSNNQNSEKVFNSRL